MKVPAAKILFGDEDRRAILGEIDEILRTGQLTLGPRTKLFEERFAKLCGVPHAVAVNSGTSSLEIVMRVWDAAGKEVIVPADTFFATAAAVVHAGAIPRFVDIEPETLSLDPAKLAGAITRNTAGVILVHIGGWMSAHLPRIQAICRERNLWLLEDAAHAHGSSAGSTTAGAAGSAASFSFYPTKVMTSGEGGMIATRDERLANEARLYRDQGKESFTSNFHTRLGSNWRLSEIHAAIGLSQLAHLPEWIDQRIRVARIYDQLLAGDELLSPLPFPKGGRTNYYKYIVRLARAVDRPALKRRLRERSEVSLAGEVYEVPCHRQPIFERYRTVDCPEADRFCAQHLCLPIFPTMTEEEATHVVRSLREALREP